VSDKEYGSGKVEVIRDLNLKFSSGVEQIHSRPAIFAKDVYLKLQFDSQSTMESN